MTSENQNQNTQKVWIGLWVWLNLTRRLRAQIEGIWLKLKPYKKRIVWTIVALLVLSVVIGGAVTIYLWRDELLALVVEPVSGLGKQIARLATKVRSAPGEVIVVATAPAEQVPAMPGVGGTEMGV